MNGTGLSAAAFAVIVGTGAATAAHATVLTVLTPVIYDMLNGELGAYAYLDDAYNGTGNKTVSLAPLSGGVGKLTDGVVAPGHWDQYSSDYVGWSSINPTITFHFGNTVELDNITFYFDGNNGGGVFSPVSVDIGLTGQPTKSFSVYQDGAGPYSALVTGLGLTGDSFDITIQRQAQWMMVSEIAFDGSYTALPLPAASLLFASGVASLGCTRRRSVT